MHCSLRYRWNIFSFSPNWLRWDGMNDAEIGNGKLVAGGIINISTMAMQSVTMWIKLETISIVKWNINYTLELDGNRYKSIRIIQFLCLPLWNMAFTRRQMTATCESSKLGLFMLVSVFLKQVTPSSSEWAIFYINPPQHPLLFSWKESSYLHDNTVRWQK